MVASSPSAEATREETARVLGVSFFQGTVAAAVDRLQQTRGYLVVPAAPAMVRLRYDAEFRTALTEADLAIADSGLMVLLWRALHSERLTRISGLAYLKELLTGAAMRQAPATCWILPTTAAREKAATWLRARGIAISDELLYVAPRYGVNIEDSALLQLLELTRPQQIVIAIGGGPQEKLGRYLKMHCSFRPAIHCIGAALGFLTGDQVAIPTWADRLYVGWLFRLFAQPRVFIPRLWVVHELPGLLLRYGRELPPLSSKRRRIA